MQICAESSRLCGKFTIMREVAGNVELCRKLRKKLRFRNLIRNFASGLAFSYADSELTLA